MIRFVLLYFALAPAALAHDSRPVAVNLVEMAPNIFRLSHIVPASVEQENLPRVSLSCAIEDRLYKCSDASTPVLEINYPKANPSLATVITFSRQNGVREVTVLPPGVEQWQITQSPSLTDNLIRYTGLGVEHILAGYDHLLFVLLLCFVARHRLIVTITGFTLAHSVTLALAALDYLRVSPVAVEATIALSIVFMAAEIIRDQRHTLFWRYPVIISSGFGLFHGLGFAAVLADIGLPQDAQFVALGAFNVGVEIGQLIFIVFLYAAHSLVTRLWPRLPLAMPLVWGGGLVAAFWLWQRVMLAF